MLLSPFNFSLPGLDYLFVFEPRLGWIAANTISTQGGGRGGGWWFRDSRVINAILRLVSFLLGRLIDHTRPFLTYNRVPRQVRPPNSGISSDVDERSSISSSPFLHSFFFFFLFLLFPPFLITDTGIWQFNWRGQERREYRIRCWSLSPVTARFNLLLLRTLGGSAARMKSYLRRTVQPTPCSFLVARDAKRELSRNRAKQRSYPGQLVL